MSTVATTGLPQRPGSGCPPLVCSPAVSWGKRADPAHDLILPMVADPLIPADARFLIIEPDVTWNEWDQEERQKLERLATEETNHWFTAEAVCSARPELAMERDEQEV